MPYKRFFVFSCLFWTLTALLQPAKAAPLIEIDRFTFDLRQFDGAWVRTNVGEKAIQEATFDNDQGFDGSELGELAGNSQRSTFDSDLGDRITLGLENKEESLTLKYGNALPVTGSSIFVVYEQGTQEAFEIIFNGDDKKSFTVGEDDFLSGWKAKDAIWKAKDAIDPVYQIDDQNQIAFKLGELGFQSGDIIEEVKFRNVNLGTDKELTWSDPDLLFGARAGEAPKIVSISLPATLPLFGIGLALIVMTRLRFWPKSVLQNT